MEKIRQELYEYINFYGINAPETIKKSEQLDDLIVKQMKEGA